MVSILVFEDRVVGLDNKLSIYYFSAKQEGNKRNKLKCLVAYGRFNELQCSALKLQLNL